MGFLFGFQEGESAYPQFVQEKEAIMASLARKAKVGGEIFSLFFFGITK